MTILFIILAVALVVTTVLDLRSTFQALASNPKAKEANPMLRWVVKIGPVPTYAFRMGANAFIIWACWQFTQPGYWQTSIWWLPIAFASALYLWLSIRNRQFYGKPAPKPDGVIYADADKHTNDR